MHTPLAETSPWLLLAAAITSVLAVARFTRLAIYDAFPPAAWIRRRYADAVPERWAELVTCPFCLAPWVQLVSLLWAWTAGLDPQTWTGGLWWLAHLWFALAYLAAMVVVRDQPIVYDNDGAELDEPGEPTESPESPES
jgi:hypothetical protein